MSSLQQIPRALALAVGTVRLVNFNIPFIASHFSTNPNSNPDYFSPSTNRHTQLEKLLLRKSRYGFDKLDDALLVFDEMIRMKPLLPVRQFNQLLASLVKMKQYSVTVSLFKDMCALPVPVDVFTFNMVINCCCHLHRVDYGFSLLGGIITHGLLPTVVTYTTLIKGMLSQHKSVEADYLFKKLIRFKLIQPDVITYTTIIDGLCKAGNTSMAVTLLGYMEKEGCKPNTVTYNTIINYLCKDRRVDHALSLFYEMCDKRISPDVITYNSLIKGVCNLNRWEDSRRLLKEMDIRNISPTMHTYSILVDAYGKEGKFKDAEDVIELMIQTGQYPDVVIYNALMDGYCLWGEIDKALAVLKTMTKGIFPNTRSYNILINGYCKKLQVDRAIDLFQQMPLKGLTPTIETYNTILQGFFHMGRHVEAHKFFREMMVNQGLILDIVTFRILLQGLCKKQYVDEALSLFHMMECNGFIPHICNYNILIDRLCKDGHLENAKSLFDNLTSKGLQPEVKTYTMMIQAFCQEGLVDKANELFVEMEASNCLPNDITYNILIRGCFQNKKYNEGCVLIDKMRTRGFSADASTTSMLLDLLESKEQDPSLLALHKKFSS